MAQRSQHRHSNAARMEQKKQGSIAAGLVSERFPSVLAMQIRMTYYRKSAIPIMMVRTVNVYPSSYAFFKMDCMTEGCSSGGFDLNAVIAGMVKTRRTLAKGTMVCRGKIGARQSDHASIEYEAVIRYKKAGKKNP